MKNYRKAVLLIKELKRNTDKEVRIPFQFIFKETGEEYCNFYYNDVEMVLYSNSYFTLLETDTEKLGNTKVMEEVEEKINIILKKPLYKKEALKTLKYSQYFDDGFSKENNLDSVSFAPFLRSKLTCWSDDDKNLDFNKVLNVLYCEKAKYFDVFPLNEKTDKIHFENDIKTVDNRVL